MPNILKIKLPASANEHSTIAQVIAERRATACRSAFGELAVTAKNMGITANGSTKKNTEVSASNANSRTEVIVGIEVGHAPRAQGRPAMTIASIVLGANRRRRGPFKVAFLPSG
jgi:hypothetical protein